MTEPRGFLLLVEDDDVDADLALRALRSAGLGERVVHVRTGEDALRFLREQAARENGNGALPSVVFLDLKLPGTGGMEVLADLREDPRLALLPVVIVTSSPQPAEVAEAYTIGVNSYLVKPVVFEAFTEAFAAAGRYWLDLNVTAVPGHLK